MSKNLIIMFNLCFRHQAKSRTSYRQRMHLVYFSFLRPMVTILKYQKDFKGSLRIVLGVQ